MVDESEGPVQIPRHTLSSEQTRERASALTAASAGMLRGTAMRIVDLLSAMTLRVQGLRGRGALAQLLWRRLGPWTTGDFHIRMGDGTIMVVPRSSWQSWYPAFTGTYDAELVDLMASKLRPGTVVIDVGACFGFWSVALGVRARAAGANVIAVEPVPANLEVLRRNVARNGLQDTVTIVEMALDRQPGRLAMTVEPGGRGNAAIGYARREMGALGDVLARRLDDVVEEVVPGGWQVIGMKLDVEGWEVRVLEGGVRTVARYRPIILGEFSTWWQERHGLPVDAPLLWAERHEYRVFRCRQVRRHAWTDRCRVSIDRLIDAREFRSAHALLLVPRAAADEVARA